MAYVIVPPNKGMRGQKLTVKSDGEILETNGIQFPATQVPSSDPNTLDDYEEGDWTPTLVGSTIPGTHTYSVRAGKYIKIGGLVYVHCQLALASHGTESPQGIYSITGLPYAATTAYSALSVSHLNPGTLAIPPANFSQMTPRVEGSAIVLLYISSAALSTYWPLDAMGLTFGIICSGCYPAIS